MLVTVRFAHLHTFEAITKRVKRRPRSAPDIFMVIMEALIDYSADRLEELRAEALKISQRIFHKEMQDWQSSNVGQVNRMLRDTLVEIGDMGERLSHIRDTLAGAAAGHALRHRAWRWLAGSDRSRRG